jgi:DNA processing protein
MPTEKSEKYELKNALALSIIPNIGDAMAKNLISYCGGVDAVFMESYTALSKIPGIGTVRARSVNKFKDWERVENEIEFITKFEIEPLLYLDKAYPNRLKAHQDSPILLFKRGDADLNANKMISIVGTRNSTDYGKKFIQDLVQDLKTYKVTVTSGLAHGVDSIAHREALKNDIPTIAVLGHGFKTLYPAINKRLAESIALGDGALLTDYFSDVPGNAENFPSRNRIVAALCDGLIVVESAYKGGSMITAEIANSYDKLTFALPGNVGNKYSQGCNVLIKLNKANVIENIGDLIYHLNWDKKEMERGRQTELFAELTEQEKLVIAILEKGDIGIDNLYYDCKMPMTKLSLILLELEMKNLIRVLPGKLYQLKT